MSRFHRQTLEHALAAKGTGPSKWPCEAVPELLSILREGCRGFVSTKLGQINVKEADLQLERSVTALIYYEIYDLLHANGGFESYRVTHEMWEFETLDPSSSRPPQYDIAFVWKGSEHLKWPCEAKVLRTDKNVAPYLSDITGPFLGCIYAPFSSSAAMLGILTNGIPTNALSLIAERLKSPIEPDETETCPSLMQTTHKRRVPKGKSYCSSLTLHHLMLKI